MGTFSAVFSRQKNGMGRTALEGVGLAAATLPGLTVENVTKAYGATVALEDVSLHLAAGRVHALLGENGAGKSTLVKILSGVVQLNNGRMWLDGKPYAPRTILQARALGVATAFQELSLPPNLNVAESLLMPTLKKGAAGLVSMRKTVEAADEILDRYGLAAISPLSSIADLTLAERQRLEIVRALHHASRVLILDEPTAALAEVDWLFGLVRKAMQTGTAILYISHRLAEVRTLCQSATVLRNGQSIADVDLAQASDAQIFELMVGHSQKAAVRAPVRPRLGAPVLQVKDLGSSKLREVSFEVRSGEILGVAALDGQGQRNLFYCLVGLEPRSSGQVLVNGRVSRPKKPRDALADGLSFLPEERKTEGIFTSLSAASNIVLPVLQRISRGGFVWPALEKAASIRSAEAVEMSPRYMDFRIGDLSGGNQQKALLARTMMTGAKTLLLFDPTRGVDVGTKEAIYAAIRAYADAGGAVLMYSSELPELVHLANRCLVLYGARLFAELEGEEIEERALVAAMTGHAQRAKSVSAEAVA
jgi:ribose transport system ATP-binding protein